jgi:acyl-CoA synthetase (AMP-forming)/AMP-acid ligase II
MHSKFDAEAAINTLQDHQISFFTAVPTIYSKLLPVARSNLSHLRVLISGSSALPLKVKEAFQALNAPITERYGMTETGMISSNVIGNCKSVGVGKALPSVTIKAETDCIADIYVKGPGLFCGYLRDGQFEAHNANDFFRTGDQGFFLDSQTGNLQLSGRDRDIFKVSGFKVAAGEIEAALSENEAVAECLACALPERNESSGSQTIAMAVKLKPQKNATAAQLKAFLASKVAYYKIPRRWIVSADLEIPRNLIGKPDIAAIQALFMKSK